jgi:hypothetical protein
MAANRKCRRVPWNKGKIVGQKAPIKLRDIWAIRVRLQPKAEHLSIERRPHLARDTMVKCSKVSSRRMMGVKCIEKRA